MTVSSLIAASLVLLLDRVTKAVSCASMHEGQSVALLPKIFHITLVFNKGIAFGLFREHPFVFIAISVIIVIALFLYVTRHGEADLLTSLSCGLIIGGALGNLIDRMRFGYVIDFLDFRVWPVFNVADSSITIGAMLLAWSIITNSKREPKT